MIIWIGMIQIRPREHKGDENTPFISKVVKRIYKLVTTTPDNIQVDQKGENNHSKTEAHSKTGSTLNKSKKNQWKGGWTHLGSMNCVLLSKKKLNTEIQKHFWEISSIFLIWSHLRDSFSPPSKVYFSVQILYVLF